MTIALFSILGVIVGAALQYVFTRILEERRHHRDLRTKAYTDYLLAISDAKHRMVQRQASYERELLARITDAKARICLYGTNSVLKELAAFERLGGQIATDDQVKTFIGLLKVMRGDRKTNELDLEVAILGLKS